MLLNPDQLRNNLDRLEDIEKASLRHVVQAICDYRSSAVRIFRAEQDLVADIAEDVTREALDKMGTARIDQRLFGKVDYKCARYLFHPDYAVRQALFVDSKAEQVSGQQTVTLQISQISMTVRQFRAGQSTEVQGSLPSTLSLGLNSYITTTIFVKYNYEEVNSYNELRSVTIAALPNGFLQGRYNPTADDTIWLAGRNAPTRDEAFRVRLSFPKLKEKCGWRVQTIPCPPVEFEWSE